MNYRIVWKPEAEKRLTTIWLDAADRQAVTDAASMIDLRLSHDPKTQGEERDAGRRILFVPPLGVIFKDNSRTRTVQVVTVWQYA